VHNSGGIDQRAQGDKSDFLEHVIPLTLCVLPFVATYNTLFPLAFQIPVCARRTGKSYDDILTAFGEVPRAALLGAPRAARKFS
jgi:hypothetical protein